MQPCSQLEAVTPQMFRDEIAPANAPVVLRGLCADWPAVAVARGSDRRLADYLAGFATPAPLAVMTAPPEVKGAFFFGESLRTRNFNTAQMTLAAVMDRLLALADTASPPAVYIQSTPAEACLPGFSARNTNPLLPEAVRPRVWIGNAVRVQTHYDLSDNIAVVVAGRRRFTLFPPDQLPNLYMGPFEATLAGSPVSLADIENPDFARFPRLRDALAAGLTAELEPGDAIFIPYGWWHHVRSLSAVNMLANYWWNEAPAHVQAPYGTLLLAMLTVRDMPPRQREVWRHMFEHFVFCAHGDPGAHLAPDERGAMATLPPAQHRKALEYVLAGFRKSLS
ncbi:cupin-like domain-containing protein [Asticcacaulis sp. EMRT-3]|uniref:cupin-like domain-containing protein n=1 Tax=Asticcacaulis sp. EMRT-3 TaxID=3040349 RepID=UPI0024AEF7F0|nr:cupin-like domain-containing protein [Asticcacaulis sp. EMRT-3]MDI7775741.1 cupin-like domain-containing protein [Asticcacaulis sp. EMRT-3]